MSAPHPMLDLARALARDTAIPDETALIILAAQARGAMRRPEPPPLDSPTRVR